MDKILVRGGRPLHGTVRISGAKNAALPCMVASLLTEDELSLLNVPCVRDIQTTGQLLAELGCEVHLEELSHSHVCSLSSRPLNSWEAPYELVKTMRASV